MEIELEARLLKQIIQFADSLEVDRLPLVADADGLHIAAADSGQINAVKAKLCPITFGKYIPDAAPKHAEAGKAQVCYHDVDVIAEVLKLAESPASVIGIKTIPKNYEVISGEVTLGAVTRSYDVCQYPPYKPSEWVYEAMPSHARVHIVQKEFYNMVKIAADLADVVTLKASKESFSMSADGVDFDGKKADAAEVIAFADPANGFVKATFNSGYLFNMAKAIPVFGTFELNISNDFPLTAKFPLAGAPASEVAYVIAPHKDKD